MSMSHRTYPFRYSAFAAELKPMLEAMQRDALERFIDANVERLRDPHGGEPLTRTWRERMERGDVQEVADFALTRYYDPREERGLGVTWQRFSDTRAVLGAAVPGFDPGRMGSYFQSEKEVLQSIERITPMVIVEGEELLKLLRRAADRGLGLYVTF